MRNILLILILFSIEINSQVKKENLYIYFNSDMNIQNVNEKIKLSFNLTGLDGEPSIYNFEIPNIDNDFKYLKFSDIKTEFLNFNKVEKNIKKLEDLSKLDFCELQYLFADTANLYMVKKEKNNNFIYRLVYISTARGWEFSKH
jgi:hypothetical protein